MSTQKEKKKKRLVLLDAHAIIHRAYHALPDFATSKGEPTGALYGLSAMLLKLVDDLKPDYIIACYDLPEPTYRHEVYEDYKAGRAKTDDDLVAQLIRSRDIFTAFDIPMYDASGFEADDILGTIVFKTKDKKDIDVVIASGDMDTLQLVKDKDVQVYTLRKGIQDTILYDEEAVKERFGFEPELLPDYKGLRGDPSDNIIGIPGIGEKTATELIVHFGTIEQMYKKLKKDEKAFLEAGIKPRIVNLLKEHEEDALFSKMLGQIRDDAPIDFSLPKKDWRDSVNPKIVLDLFADLNFRTLARRVETMFAITGSVEERTPEKEPLQLSEKEALELGVVLWILNSDITNPTVEDILQFTKADTIEAARSYLFAELKKQKLEHIYNDIELPLISVIREMHETGIKLDLEYVTKLSKDYHKELAKLENNIWKHAGKEFNINSPRQLADILFDELGIAIKNQKKTSTGQRSTRESELEKMRELHPIIDDILMYRELQKLLSTYIDNLPTMVDKKDRLHTTFIQTGATTGRMASHNPNLQNIPIRTEKGRAIRNAFIADQGFDLVALDYSQIELRIAAFLSKDEKLIEVFKNDGDVHRAVASEVFAVPPEMVDSEMRRRAKIINFGIIYGMGVNALRASLGTTRAEAQEFYNEYFKNFSGLAHFLDHTKATAARVGYTETLFGRRRYFEGMKSSLPHIRAHAERMAINAPIQGTQSDIIKIAMRQVYDYLRKEKLEKEVRMLLQVHDELVFEIQKKRTKETVPILVKIMQSVLPLEKTEGVPLKVDAAVGKNWGELKPV